VNQLLSCAQELLSEALLGTVGKQGFHVAAMTSHVFTRCQETSRHLVRHNRGKSVYDSSAGNRQQDNNNDSLRGVRSEELS
jgi:hypothetical protein